MSHPNTSPLLDHQVLTALNAGIGMSLKSKLGSEGPLPETLQRLMLAFAKAD